MKNWFLIINILLSKCENELDFLLLQREFNKTACCQIVKNFDYNKFYEKIAEFFKKNADKLRIHSCFYCDAAYTGAFLTNRSRRTFDVDHFFPKSEYPMFSLSLYNFVPSCQVCNSRVKGRNNFIDFYSLNQKSSLKKDLLQISPISKKYDMASNLTIKVYPEKNNTALGKSKQNWLAYFGGKCFDLVAFILRRKFSVIAIRVKEVLRCKLVCTNTCFTSSHVPQTSFVPPVSLENELRTTIEYEFIRKVQGMCSIASEGGFFYALRVKCEYDIYAAAVKYIHYGGVTYIPYGIIIYTIFFRTLQAILLSCQAASVLFLHGAGSACLVMSVFSTGLRVYPVLSGESI